ncbi:histidine phosphatase family protein [Paratractidigestivibacter sp.]|uniref:histidine phosphatase family protein n=1 Tax=Paratractidigestivibacter sp. TaxID=2847316 RepID=UPI002ABD1623|nr:histidine phosphatase family protein [Paratractidigestivibacter sp.]
MKTLYLMRHGQTMLNAQKRIQGWFDSPLTDEGREQAKRAGALLAERCVRPASFACSTAERCSDTLEIVRAELAAAGLADADAPYERDRRVKEMFFGQLEGLPETLSKGDPEACRTYYLQFGGESSDAVRDRLALALDDRMAASEAGDSVFVVSHGGATYNFLRAVEKNAAEVLAAGWGNCVCAVYEWDEGARAEAGATDALGAPMPADVAAAAARFRLVDVLRP